jgi:hypothetical protein
MKILLIDIETSPNLAHVWQLWHADVGLSQLREASEVICFAAKWLNYGKVMFFSAHHDGKDSMIRQAHALLDEADVVMHYNGKRFDVPHLNREFLLAGLRPPSPYAQIDLLAVVKREFRFPSNKLDYVSKALGLEGKAKHEGHQLWVSCLAGDEQAWTRMARYNKQDVLLLEQLYAILQPWISGHPSYGAYEGADLCPACGSPALEKRGFAYTRAGQFQRYVCQDCGKWSRSAKRLSNTEIVEVA